MGAVNPLVWESNKKLVKRSAFYQSAMMQPSFVKLRKDGRQDPSLDLVLERVDALVNQRIIARKTNESTGQGQADPPPDEIDDCIEAQKMHIDNVENSRGLTEKRKAEQEAAYQRIVDAAAGFAGPSKRPKSAPVAAAAAAATAQPADGSPASPLLVSPGSANKGKWSRGTRDDDAEDESLTKNLQAFMEKAEAQLTVQAELEKARAEREVAAAINAQQQLSVLQGLADFFARGAAGGGAR